MGAVATLAGAQLVSDCGNGVIDAGEQCDDGNVLGGDCCSASCQYENAGSVCDDANACTVTDTCDAFGSCTAGAPLTCDNGQFCDGFETCDSQQGCDCPGQR